MDHLLVLSDDVGIIQHALEDVPDRKTGYCTDDAARAFMVAVAHMRVVADRAVEPLARSNLAFLQHAQLDDGRFHNFMGYDRRWLDEVGTHDSCGRAIWALGYGAAFAPAPSWRSVCARLLDRAMPSIGWLGYVRSRAYAMLGLSYAHASGQTRYGPVLQTLADDLLAAFRANASADWPWFEDVMTYDNARLPEALIRAGRQLGESRYLDAGLEALDFYARVTTENGVYVPIGNDGWYRRGGRRARYDQQPLEACAMVDAQLAAREATGDAAHAAAAELALAWYYGKNSRGVVMARGGGCCDGLSEDSVNPNMGAESTLALHAAALAMADRRPRILRAVR